MSLVWSISKHLALSQEPLLTTLFRKGGIGEGSRAQRKSHPVARISDKPYTNLKAIADKAVSSVILNKHVLERGALLRWSPESHALYKAPSPLMISLVMSIWHPSDLWQPLLHRTKEQMSKSLLPPK